MAPSGMHDIGEHQRVGVQCAENCGASMVVTSPMPVPMVWACMWRQHYYRHANQDQDSDDKIA